MGVNDYGLDTDPLNSPSYSAWAGAVATELTSVSASVDTLASHNHITGDAEWTTMVLINGWTNYDTVGYGPAKFKKTDGGLVVIRGMILGGTANLCYTLPVGYRPTNDFIMPSAFTGAGGSNDTELPFGLGVRQAGTVEVRRNTYLAAWYAINVIFFAGD